jgi:hypothetical protein
MSGVGKDRNGFQREEELTQKAEKPVEYLRPAIIIQLIL